MSNDTQRVFQGMFLLHFLWYSFTCLLVILSLMIVEVGPIAIAGFALIVLSVRGGAFGFVCLGVVRKLTIWKKKAVLHFDKMESRVRKVCVLSKTPYVTHFDTETVLALACDAFAVPKMLCIARFIGRSFLKHVLVLFALFQLEIKSKSRLKNSVKPYII